MAKKQNRSNKKENASKSDNAPHPSNSQSTASSSFRQPFTNLQFGLTIGILIGTAIYFVGFLFVKTEIGDRFGSYLALALYPDLFWSFWTGSPSGQFGLLDRVPLFAGFAFHLTLAVGTGRFIGRYLLNCGRYTTLESRVLELGLGLTALSAYTLLIGLLQIYSLKAVAVLPVAIVSACGFWFHWKGNKQTLTDLKPDFESEADESHWTQWVWLLCVPFGLFIFLGSSVPPWEFDVREYHLQIPKEWYQAGGVDYVAHNVYGNMPLGTEMHALFAMLFSIGTDDWWWGALIGKTVSGSFAIFNCFLLFAIGKRLFGSFSGVCASLLYVSTPWTTANSIVGYNESAVAFYLLAAILVLVVSLQDSDVKSDKKTWILIGLFCGSTVAAKYTAVPFVCFPMIIFVLVWLQRSKCEQPIGVVMTFLILGMVITAGPWLGKNWILTGNPTYPLAASVFGSPMSDAQIEQWEVAHSPKSFVPEADEVAAKSTSLFIGYKWLSPILIPFFAMGFFGVHRRTNYFLLGYLIFAFFVWLLFTHRLERFLLPFYPVACLVGGAGATWLHKASWRNMATGVLVLGTLLNGLFATSRLIGDARIFATLKNLDSRKLDATDYFHPDGLIVPLNHLSIEIAWLNQSPSKTKVLFYGECRPFTAEFDVVYNTCFDPCETWKLLGEKSPGEMHKSLIENQITHILINESELERLRSTYGYNVDHSESIVQLEAIKSLDGKYLKRITSFGKLGDGAQTTELLFEVLNLNEASTVNDELSKNPGQ